MTSSKFLRGPRWPFAPSTVSTSTTSLSDHEHSSTPTTAASTANTSLSSSWNNSHSGKTSIRQVNDARPLHRDHHRHQQAPSQPLLEPSEQSQTAPLPERALSGGARDVKTSIRDKFALLKPSSGPPRSQSQTWGSRSRRLSAFLPGQSFFDPTNTHHHNQPPQQPQQQQQKIQKRHRPQSQTSNSSLSSPPQNSPPPPKSEPSPELSPDSAVAWGRPFHGAQDHTNITVDAIASPPSPSLPSNALPQQPHDLRENSSPSIQVRKRSFTVDTHRDRLDKSPWTSIDTDVSGPRPRHNTVGSPDSVPPRLTLPVLRLQLPSEAIAVPPSPPGATPTHPDYPPPPPPPETVSPSEETSLSPIIVEAEEPSRTTSPSTGESHEDHTTMMMHMDRAQHPHQFVMPLRKESLPARKDSLGVPASVRSVQTVTSTPAALPRSVSPGAPSVMHTGSVRSGTSFQPPSQSGSVRSSVGSPRTGSNHSDAKDSRPSTSTSQSHRQSSRSGSPSVATTADKEKDKESVKKLRKSWFPSTRSRPSSVDLAQSSAHPCWVMDTKAEYNSSLLVNGEKIPELWTEAGDVYVYLFPKESGIGPSFKVPQMVIQASVVFEELIQAEWANQADSRSSSPPRVNFSRHRLPADDGRTPSPPPMMTPPAESHLYIVDAPEMRPDPLDPLPDIERLVALRNVFAFLMGQPLVATKRSPTYHEAFVNISGVLEEFVFTSEDGSSFGEIVDMVFSSYLEKMGLVDLRRGKERILQALILGERMRSVELYNSAFAHAVGRHPELLALKSRLYEQVTPYTRQKIERARFNLTKRLESINIKLEQFDFPSIFVGMAASTSNEELRKVRFKIWRGSFNRMRAFVVGYYKTAFGSWPPKASNKKNPFSESGLNRLVLKTLYSDMCALYDLLVNRQDLTTRELHGLPENIPMEGDGMITGLRRLLSEFENSLSPTPPPVPFDTPIVPSMTSILETYNTLPAKEQLRYQKHIRDNELSLVLNKAYNYDVNALNVRFLDAFKSFEHKEAKGKLAADIADQRMGYWVFLYVVLQSLPMLIVDAPGLKQTDGIEYFLCEAPWGNPPWVEDAGVRKMWYEVAGGTGIVELPADYIMFSTEAIYHRSHCWVAAKEWESLSDPAQPGGAPIEEPGGLMSPLAPPSHVFQNPESSPRGSPHSAPSSRTPSPGPGSPQLLPPPAVPRSLSPSPNRRTSQYHRRSSIAIGIEPLTAPDSLDILSGHHRGGSGGGSSNGYVNRRASSVNPAAYSRSRPVSRVVSAGNFTTMSSPLLPGEIPPMPPLPTSPDTDPPAHKEQTFDDILGELPQTKKKKAFF